MPNFSTGETADLADQGAIWQVQPSAANGTEATATLANTILFNNITSKEAGGFVFDKDIQMRNSIPENTSIQGGQNDIEDMGTDGIEVTVTGTLVNNAADTIKIRQWWLADKFTVLFTKGRFGLRMDDIPAFNVTPTATYGYQIGNPRIFKNQDESSRIGFTVVLRLGGDFQNAF